MRQYDPERGAHMKKIEWIAIIQEQQASGMSMKEFCNDRNISYSLFKNHKNSLK